MTLDSKLALGGHSFIAELGSDPLAGFEDQCAIVSECLDRGISWFDTTYYQERVALGRVLQTLGRRDEARITAWNFFRLPNREHELVPPSRLNRNSLDEMLAELQTDVLDMLVIHAHDDAEVLNREIALAQEWVLHARVRDIGLGMAEYKHLPLVESEGLSAVFAPYNVFDPSAAALFGAASERGVKTFAMSPFVRGWRLEQAGIDAERVADHLLRWVTGQSSVRHAVVSMRRSEWVMVNLASESKGPLNETEVAMVTGWK